MKDVLDINKDKPCVITLHGPSLNLHKEAVSKKQESGDAIRISVNNWFDYFTTPPDYWVLSSSEHGFPIRNLFHIIKEHNMPIFYSDDGDLIILISSSGESKNMINAANYCRINKIKLITFTGFNKNNKVSKLGDLNFWVNSKKYNYVENIHQTWLLSIIDKLSKNMTFKKSRNTYL